MVSVRRKKQTTSPSTPKHKHQEVNSFPLPPKKYGSSSQTRPHAKAWSTEQFLSSVVQQLKGEEQKGAGCVSSARRQRGWAAFPNLRNPRAALAEAGLPAQGAGCAPVPQTVQTTGHHHGPSQCPHSLLHVPAPARPLAGPRHSLRSPYTAGPDDGGPQPIMGCHGT